MQKLYVGIDPGLDGALAAIDGNGIVGIWDAPTVTVKVGKKNRRKYVPAQMAHLLKTLPKAETYLVGLELVRSMPGQGVVSMFSMGHGLGLWEGIISGLELPIAHVSPVVWKKAMLKGGIGQEKAASILRAQEIFPGSATYLTRKKDDGRAEALLIAAYIRDHQS